MRRCTDSQRERGGLRDCVFCFSIKFAPPNWYESHCSSKAGHDFFRGGTANATAASAAAAATSAAAARRLMPSSHDEQKVR